MHTDLRFAGSGITSDAVGRPTPSCLIRTKIVPDSAVVTRITPKIRTAGRVIMDESARLVIN